MSQRTIESERRSDARKRPLSLVYVELTSANGGMLRDLSEVGFAVRAMMPLRVGEVTPFSFSLDEDTKLEGQCKVLWVEEGGRVAGLNFTEVPAGLREQVRAWLGEDEVYTAPASQLERAAKTSQVSTMEELREELRAVGARPEAPEKVETKIPELIEDKPLPAEEKQIAKEEKLAMQGTEPPVEESKPTQPVLVESAFTKLRKIEFPRSSVNLEPLRVPQFEPGPRIGSQPVPVLESLPALEPLPTLYETEYKSFGNKRKPSLTGTIMWLAIRMVIVLALIAAAAVYHQPVGNALIWLGQKIVGEEAPEISPLIPKSAITPPEQEKSPASAASDSGAANVPALHAGTDKSSKETTPNADNAVAGVPEVIENPSPEATKNPVPPAPVPLPATNKITTFTPPVATAPDGGQQELLAAQDILKNGQVGAGLAEAVRLLWSAVEKGNPGAEIALAELYWQGHGVAKNCDQTKILLTAAAKKGSAEAQKLLNQFLSEGCEE